MRVIAGSAKGKKLKVPKSNIRPLSDQAKEGLFNILQPRIADSYFLDLFSGTGSVAIEALSRGATLSILVELDRKHVQVIRENLAHCICEDRAEIYALDVLAAIKILKRKEAKFDIIFLGAPYGNPSLEKALEELADGVLLKENGLVIAECRFKHDLAPDFGKLTVKRTVRYGDTVLTFYESSNIPG
ncbi:16S rRNA (guanine(966)-N(2))-methyltransferase RsmD [candidate division WOR-1 bacterium RIFOXYB2_FULL_42_35]|uniref:16S rRNA (Guanine(966)-N(2))-methyltransferase RsmD n=1 Tax=candidate division WOR-1 bacterium RIFOXYC2_FULL_41_25 TaxID=1802586 RepID=A0A1F4TMD7_UNCSA|nr:MAG: 16S rRNA (guanine(966)-N(2))-methyltransferase RsmD [candidate division WOR-1 bacterium RIFOXYA2_FULL_41_14]OGC22495.1 MAG: 16S rRNA (guanine(966)-N(2))-methyltransferase RsmD [candidate division WOR-1 bacterium RIFOXYB2_FULL_42_35]OGC33233.1 MAG: 16S rRNA (guanine(966)-N(2))-methyltransferase RsmD [candidate division WOR-1 bacterium RIFOXYC2_FULL_41_25]OGC42767.1 MAG: 16S rRNA (guanine(966)-N(2))-methyltransferase RsmD [candidate division WOR-1 bacterium RIFOXYD2_FULL_41_8]